MIEVATQTELLSRRKPLFTVVEYATYLQNCSKEHKVLNMLSLEVSDTTFDSHVLVPELVRNIDWTNTIWPVICIPNIQFMIWF